MTGIAATKYVLALAGVSLVLLGESIGRRWLGYIGLGLVITAFFLRFVRRSQGPDDAG